MFDVGSGRRSRRALEIGGGDRQPDFRESVLRHDVNGDFWPPIQRDMSCVMPLSSAPATRLEILPASEGEQPLRARARTPAARIEIVSSDLESSPGRWRSMSRLPMMAAGDC